jgi:hypothetical protein
MEPMHPQGGELEREPLSCVWTVGDTDQMRPKIGTLAKYARDLEMAYISGDFLISGSVWVTNKDGSLTEHVVKVERGQATESGHIPYTFSVKDETAVHFFDGAA